MPRSAIKDLYLIYDTYNQNFLHAKIDNFGLIYIGLLN